MFTRDPREQNSMNIRIRFFARAAELAAGDHHSLQLPARATVGDLRKELGIQFPNLQPMLATLLIAIGTDYVTDDTGLSEDQEVVCFPPVSGG